jgi:hypothetical protein
MQPIALHYEVLRCLVDLVEQKLGEIGTVIGRRLGFIERTSLGQVVDLPLTRLDILLASTDACGQPLTYAVLHELQRESLYAGQYSCSGSRSSHR